MDPTDCRRRTHAKRHAGYGVSATFPNLTISDRRRNHFSHQSPVLFVVDVAKHSDDYKQSRLGDQQY